MNRAALAEIKELVEALKTREATARQAGRAWPVESRVAGYFAGVAAGAASAIEEIERILEENA
jgi:hypothetical protein